jgi:hypothetical protein
MASYLILALEQTYLRKVLTELSVLDKHTQATNLQPIKKIKTIK